MKKHKGFTLVELLVVIVVIAILATIGIVSYSYVRGDANDAKIRSIVKTVGEAIQIRETRGDGVPSQGFFNASGGVDDMASSGKYLKQGYRDGVKSSKSYSADRVFYWLKCGTGGDIVIYARLNNPTTQDKDHFRKVRGQCNHNSIAELGSGSPDGNDYSYAQRF